MMKMKTIISRPSTRLRRSGMPSREWRRPPKATFTPAICPGLLVDFEIELGEPTVRRGDELELTARGFAAGTTVIFWRDSNMDSVFNRRGAVLCRTEANADAVATCTIPVTNPPFDPGLGNCTLQLKYMESEKEYPVGKIASDFKPSNCNFINARDGEGHTSILVLEKPIDGDSMDSMNGDNGEDGDDDDAPDPKPPKLYNVEDALQVLELGGTVRLGTILRTHSTVTMELLDFPHGEVESIRIGGFPVDLKGVASLEIPEEDPEEGPVEGRLTLDVPLPGGALPGLLDIRVIVERAAGACDRDDDDNCFETPCHGGGGHLSLR